MSRNIVKQLLKDNGFVKRKASKNRAMKEVEGRNEQFLKIAELRSKYEKSNNPILSIDTKKKEMLGNFYREGKLYTQKKIEVYDHDFASFADGMITPHGIYDIKRNRAFINLGMSKDTSEFACDCIKVWWEKEGKKEYKQADSILILADGGGSNNSRHYIFKEDLQKLANDLKLEIRVAHYPPYTSKYNPIEHRVFSHLSRACQGVVFTGVELVKSLMERTTTKTGLSVTVNIMKKIYKTGREASKKFRENMPVIFDEELGKWNYRVVPELA